jgi:hypothetical protein
VLGADALESPPAALIPPYPEPLLLAYELEAPPMIPLELLDPPSAYPPLALALPELAEAAPPLPRPPPPAGEPPAFEALSLAAELHAPTSRGATHKAQRQAHTRTEAVERPWRVGSRACIMT